jgi:5'-methylthioadenosine/S-adenosylhomocysteine nucleosidase
MILILGNSSDSLIYLKNMLRYSEPAMEPFELTSWIGKIYGQDVCLAETGYSNYRSEIITAHLIQKYNPYIVIFLGDSSKISPSLALGDILLADFIQIIDVDQVKRDSMDNKLYAVPGFPVSYNTSDYMVRLFNECSAHVDVLNCRIGAVISGNKAIDEMKELDYNADAFQAAHHTELAYDSEVGGVQTACAFYGVPLFPILSVASDLNSPASTLERKRVILKDAVDIGKTVVSIIAEISTDENTFIRGDEAEPSKRMKF